LGGEANQGGTALTFAVPVLAVAPMSHENSSFLLDTFAGRITVFL